MGELFDVALAKIIDASRELEVGYRMLAHACDEGDYGAYDIETAMQALRGMRCNLQQYLDLLEETINRSMP